MTGTFSLYTDGSLIETVTIDGHIGFFLSHYFGVGATIDYTVYSEGTVIGQYFYRDGEHHMFSLYKSVVCV